MSVTRHQSSCCPCGGAGRAGPMARPRRGQRDQRQASARPTRARHSHLRRVKNPVHSMWKGYEGHPRRRGGSVAPHGLIYGEPLLKYKRAAFVERSASAYEESRGPAPTAPEQRRASRRPAGPKQWSLLLLFPSSASHIAAPGCADEAARVCVGPARPPRCSSRGSWVFGGGGHSWHPCGNDPRPLAQALAQAPDRGQGEGGAMVAR